MRKSALCRYENSTSIFSGVSSTTNTVCWADFSEFVSIVSPLRKPQKILDISSVVNSQSFSPVYIEELSDTFKVSDSFP